MGRGGRGHEKHDLYYCGLLLLFGGGKGRHFYEEGIDGRARADGPKNRQREYEDERTVIEKSLKHPTRNFQLIYLDIKIIYLFRVIAVLTHIQIAHESTL